MTTFTHLPVEIDGEREPQWAAKVEAYMAFLAGQDFSSAGDLVPYFGHDFFHDSDIELSLGDRESSVGLKLTAFVDIEQDDGRSEVEVPFTVEFLGLDCFSVEFERSSYGLQCFLYSEIDGLSERIVAAQEKHGGEYHSLLVECGNGWMAFVFQAVRVTAVDPVAWMNLMRNPKATLRIFGLK